MEQRLIEVFEANLAALAVSEVQRDDDGDWVISIDNQRVLARIFRRPINYLYLWTGVAQNLDAECIGEVNSFNAGAVIARLVFIPDAGTLFAGTDLSFAGLNPKSLEIALQAVESVARGAGPLFRAVYATDGV